MIKLLFKNGQIVTENGIFKKDVLVENGKIKEIGDDIKEKGEIVDIKGKFLMPGLIDVHVHLRDPGHTMKEDFETGSKAAVAGGVTTVFDMPNNNPPTTTFELFEKKRESAKGRFYSNYGFYFGVTKDNFDEIKKIKNAVGLKVFLGSSTGNMLLNDNEILEKIFSLKNKLIVVHAEDESIIKANLEKYKDISGPEKHGLVRSPKAAYSAVKKALHLAKKHDTRLHIAHVSTKEEIVEIKKFKIAKISCEVTPHHLFLTVKDYFELGHFVKTNPPLRTEEDVDALWQGINDGIIDMIATDHAPHLKSEKESKYESAPSGIPGLETMIPLMLDNVNKGGLNLEDLVRLGSYNPAKLFNVKNKGQIKKGFDADLVVVDMDLEKEVRDCDLFTKCGWSSFNGWKLKGWPVCTIVNGEIVMKDGKIVGRKAGKEISF